MNHLGMYMVKRKIFVCFMFILMFFWFAHVCFAVDKAAADEALIDAENELASAYVSVAEAEDGGAEVSELMVKLESAASLLSDAGNSYRLGDYDKAYSCAVNCSDSVEGIVSAASSLKLKAEDAYNERLFATATMSSAVLSVLFVLSLFGWKFWKNRYYKRVLEMKPEVREG
jgi:hypothetical protein